MSRIYRLLITLFLINSFVFQGCVKEFLDVKRDKSQVIPETLEDFQSLIDYNMNVNFPGILGEVGNDDIFLPNSQLASITTAAHRNGYIWADEVYEGEGGEDWNNGFEKILIANFVLEGVRNIQETPSNKKDRDHLLGTAHFYRGMYYFVLAQLFCEQYDGNNGENALGLPIRLVSNININVPRSTLEATYQTIMDDLTKAEELLSNEFSANTRPNKVAAQAMLANAYLQISDYTNALKYSDRALETYSYINDFNEFNLASAAPFPFYGQNNQEIIFYAQMAFASILMPGIHLVDQKLLDIYQSSDLRRVGFFNLVNDQWTFKGQYTGTIAFMFTGLSVPETLLVRAEAKLRGGDKYGAIEDLDMLRAKRFSSQDFTPIDKNMDNLELLAFTLDERRRELAYRGRRWWDLKRLEKTDDIQLPLKRIVNGNEYKLEKGSSKWVWPVPPDVVELGHIEQSKR